MGFFGKNKQKVAKESENMNAMEEIAEQLDDSKATEEIEDVQEEHQKENDEIPEERDFTDNTDESYDRSIADMIDQVIDYFTQVEPIKLNMLERKKIRKEDFEYDVHNYIKKLTSNKEEHDKVFDGFASFVWRYDILDELIDDDEISDIKVYRWDHIRIKRFGHRETSELKFRNPKHFERFVEHTAIKNKVSISDQNAAQNFVDKESSDKAILRFNITTGFINSSGGYLLSIRKILKHKYTVDDLINYGMLTTEKVKYFKQRIAEEHGFLIAGQGGAGKTIFLNWIIDQIPEDKSGLVIQENEELFSDHPDIAFEHTVMNRGEGKIEYTLQDLARNGLLTDIDYFVIGEIKGGEALYLLNAIYTGAKGMATCHGASSTEAMKKLVDYIKYNSTYSQEEALQMLVHLDTVVYMKDFCVKEVAEIERYNPEKKDFDYKKVF